MVTKQHILGLDPVPAESGDYDDPAVRGPLRDTLRPIEITQPEGPSFSLDGNALSWQDWSMRIGFDAREGLTLHQISLHDDGRERPVIYRASIPSATTPWCRATRTRCAARWTRRSGGTRPATAGSRCWPTAGPASRTTTRSRRSAAPAWSASAWRPGGPTRFRVHMTAIRHPCAGDLLYGADPVLAAQLGLTRQWLHAVSLAFEHPSGGGRAEFRSEYPADLSRALDVLRGQE